MAVEFELIFTGKVVVLPWVTLSGGVTATNYAIRSMMEVKGTTGNHTSSSASVLQFTDTSQDWVNFMAPSEKSADDFVEWSTLSASKPAFLQPLMDSYSASVSATVVNNIENQLIWSAAQPLPPLPDAPINDNVPDWKG